MYLIIYQLECIQNQGFINVHAFFHMYTLFGALQTRPSSYTSDLWDGVSYIPFQHFRNRIIISTPFAAFALCKSVNENGVYYWLSTKMDIQWKIDKDLCAGVF